MAKLIIRVDLSGAEFHWDGARDDVGPDDVDSMVVGAVLHALADDVHDENLRSGSFGKIKSPNDRDRNIGAWEVRGD